MNNISIISFLQGINTGGNMYNGYAIVTNNANKEVVQEEDIYIVVGDEYHKITDKDILENLSSNSYGALSLDFKRRSINSNGNTVYYYPESAFACYNCVVNQSNTQRIGPGGVYEYLDKLSDSKYNTLKQKYYTALGRERYGKGDGGKGDGSIFHFS